MNTLERYFCFNYIVVMDNQSKLAAIRGMHWIREAKPVGWVQRKQHVTSHGGQKYIVYNIITRILFSFIVINRL